MTMRQARAAIRVLGVYRLYWKVGGYSVASVGCLHNGRFWFAPANWSSQQGAGVICGNWGLVERVELIEVTPHGNS